MKKQFFTLIAIFIASITLAQTNGLNYKALITNNGNVFNTQNVTFKFTILQNGTTSVYQETQDATTDANGIVAVNIGEGNVVSGNFSSIDWENASYFLKVEIDTGSGFTDFGTTEFKYVPYAKYAEKAGNVFSGSFTDLTNVPTGLSDGDDVNDADHDATNELQTLSFNNTSRELTISNGNSVTIPAGSSSSGDGWGTQTAATDGSINGDGTSANPLSVNTSDAAFNGWDKNASDDFSGSFTDLTNVPAGLSDGDDVNDADHDATNELQTISKTGNTVTLSNGGGSFTDAVDDADNDPTNEIELPATANNGQVLTYNGTSWVAQDAAATGAQELNDLSDARYTGNSVFIGEESGSNDDGSNNYNTSIGFRSLHNNTTGFWNTAGGSYALYSNTTGSLNTAEGNSALYSNTTGYSNTAQGSSALQYNTTGSNNTAQGSSALDSNTTGNRNTAQGSSALDYNTTGSNNTATGYKSLYSNTTGSYNTAQGSYALSSNTTGYSNVAVGVEALYYNTDKSNLVAVGDSALYHNGIGATNSYEAIRNTAIGSKALYSNTTGGSNTAQGSYALYSNTTGSRNIAQGSFALYSNTTGSDNTAQGTSALSFNTTGSGNTAQGGGALYSNTTGYSNVAVGVLALFYNSDKSNLVAVGDSALYHNGIGATNSYEAIANTAIGSKALYSNTSGSYNTAQGSGALYSNTMGGGNTALGVSALYYNTTGFENTAQGVRALYSNTTGFENTAQGVRALYYNTTGSYNTAQGIEALHSNTTGSFNTALGMGALSSNTTGDDNTAVGTDAGYYCTGNRNVFIGHAAGLFETGDDKLYIANSATNSPLIWGDFSQSKLKINGSMEVTEKLTASDSGDADMKAYVYGLVYYNGSIDANRSSAGFTVSKTATGVYEITLTGVTDHNYIVSATAEIGGGGVPVVATTDYSSTDANKFIIRIYQISGASLIDNSFHFIVFKK
jgi:hypothetical protein